MFRRRRYEPRDHAYFVAFLRTILPWFCNSNGPERRVLWGNPSPYPVANIIAGHWIRDVYLLRRPGGAAAVVRPPVPAGKYFIDGPYQARRREARWPERLAGPLDPSPHPLTRFQGRLVLRRSAAAARRQAGAVAARGRAG